MVFFSFLLTFVLVFILFRKVKDLKINLSRLNKEISNLKNEIVNFKNQTGSLNLDNSKKEQNELSSNIPSKNQHGELGPREEYVLKKQQEVALKKTTVAVKKGSSLQKSPFWTALEKNFSENLTGVFGTFILTLGVIFFAIYASVRLEPFGRFIVVCSFSVIFFLLYLYLFRKVFWKNIALWIRCASGVTFLVACLGSSQFEAMKWIFDPILGISLLCVGLILNLFLGYFSTQSRFATTHVALSIIALCFTPASSITLGLVSLIASLGILMSFKGVNWERHNIVVSVLFCVVHLLLAMQMNQWLQSDFFNPLLSVLFCLGVGLSAIIVHYWKAFRSAAFGVYSSLSHIVAWVTLGLNLSFYSKYFHLSSVTLLVASVMVFYMSYKARKLSVNWLYVSDRLTSLFLLLLSAASLTKLGYAAFDAFFLCSIVSTIFFAIVSEEYEKHIFKITNIVLLITHYVLFFVFVGLYVTEDKSLAFSYCLKIFLSFVILSISLYRVQRKTLDNQKGFSISFGESRFFTTFMDIPLACHVLVLFFFGLRDSSKEWLLCFPLTASTVLTFLRKKINSPLLDISLISVIVLSFSFSALIALGDFNSPTSDAFISICFILIAISAFLFAWSERLKQSVTWPGIGLFWATLMLAAFVFTSNISSLFPSVLWLVISLIFAELKDASFFSPQTPLRHNQSNTYIAFFGLLSIGFSLVRFFLVDISNESVILETFRGRILLEFLSVGVFVYWLKFSENIQIKFIKSFVNYLLEVALVSITAFLFLEIDQAYNPLIWASLSLFCLIVGMLYQDFNRLRVYGYLYFFLALFNISFISSTVTTPSSLLTDQSWFLALLAFVLCLVFVLTLFRLQKKSPSYDISFPFLFSKFNLLHLFAVRYQLRFFLYPLFASGAFFLFWTFDRSILSLLWIAECFLLFLISIIMREPQFRVVSMMGVVIVFLRILFYDLVGKDFFLKSIVFILVGVVLIAMNTIYNKYKDRYESKKIDS
jgi:hypothetical protein